MRKRSWPLLLAFILLLALAACSKNDNEDIRHDQPQAVEASELKNGDIYLEAYYSAVNPMANVDTITDVARVGNFLLIGGERKGVPVLGLSLYAPGDGGRATVFGAASVELDDPEAEDEAALYGVTADSESFYVLTGQSVGERHYQGNIAVLHYSSDGQFLEKCQLSIGPAAQLVGFSIGESEQVAVYTLVIPYRMSLKCGVFARERIVRRTKTRPCVVRHKALFFYVVG